MPSEATEAVSALAAVPVSGGGGGVVKKAATPVSCLAPALLLGSPDQQLPHGS